MQWNLNLGPKIVRLSINQLGQIPMSMIMTPWSYKASAYSFCLRPQRMLRKYSSLGGKKAVIFYISMTLLHITSLCSLWAIERDIALLEKGTKREMFALFLVSTLISFFKVQQIFRLSTKADFD